MTTVYAVIQIQDALLKMGLYFNVLTSNSSQQRCEKAIHLATETFMKYMQNQEFAKECYDKIRNLVHNKCNYYALLLLDQILKNNKLAYKSTKKDADFLFKGVWQKVWAEPNNQQKLQNLKLIVKVWGYIYGQKVEEGIRKWIQQNYKIKFSISAQRQAELKQLYSVPEPPKADFKMQQLIHNMEATEDKSKKKSSRDESLLEALGIEQD